MRSKSHVVHANSELEFTLRLFISDNFMVNLRLNLHQGSLDIKIKLKFIFDLNFHRISHQLTPFHCLLHWDIVINTKLRIISLMLDLHNSVELSSSRHIVVKCGKCDFSSHC
jgi:hypothetical protein